jgi:hypothetical protein
MFFLRSVCREEKRATGVGEGRGRDNSDDNRHCNGNINEEKIYAQS